MATFYTSYDQGHRHKVTIPQLKAVRARHRGQLRGLGQMPGPRWYRIYEGTLFVGWAWAQPGDAALFGNNCPLVRTEAPGGWFDAIFGARNPNYQGASAWFQVWFEPTKSFIGWYDVGYFTAKKIAHSCPMLSVFTSHGQRI